MIMSIFSAVLTLILFLCSDYIFQCIMIPLPIIQDICYNTNIINSTIGVYILYFVYILIVGCFILSIPTIIHRKIIKRNATKFEVILPSLVIGIVAIIDIKVALHHGFLGNLIMLTYLSRLLYGTLFVYIISDNEI